MKPDLRAVLAAMTPGPWPETSARGEPIVWHEMDGEGWTAIGPVHSDDDDNVPGGPAYLSAARDSLGMRRIRNEIVGLLDELDQARADLATERSARLAAEKAVEEMRAAVAVTAAAMERNADTAECSGAPGSLSNARDLRRHAATLRASLSPTPPTENDR